MEEPLDRLRVLLVRPPGRFRSLSFPDGPMVAPPRSLLYLAAAVRHDPRVEVRVLDALAEPDPSVLASPERPVLFGLEPAEVARRAVAFRADLVGVSTMASYFRRETVELCRAVREALPGAFLLLGGPDPTVDAERYLEAAPIDAVCVGEGEATFAELVDRLARGAGWTDVAGLALRVDGVVRRTPRRAPLADLDAVVPDLGLVDVGAYFALAAKGWRSRPTLARPGVERAVDLVTSRGCPYPCSFCVIHTTMGRSFRTRSIPSVVDELRTLVEVHGVRHVHVEDDVLNLDRRRFAELLRAIARARLPLTWDAPNGVRADLLDAETVALCRESGCVYLILAVESGVQRVLDEVVDKRLRLEDVEEAARLCHEARLDAMAFYIVGMPGETLDEARRTVAFALDLFDRFGVTPLLQVWRPYVGTSLYDRALGEGALHEADPEELHARSGVPFTQFRDVAALRGEVTVEALAELFARYSERLALGQLARWRRAGVRWGDGSDGRAAVERFLREEAPFLHARARRADQARPFRGRRASRIPRR